MFAGLKEGAFSGSSSDTVSCRVIRAWQKHRESLAVPLQGSLTALPLDVTREDISHEAVGLIRAHLPAGEDGKGVSTRAGKTGATGAVTGAAIGFSTNLCSTPHVMTAGAGVCENALRNDLLDATKLSVLTH